MDFFYIFGSKTKLKFEFFCHRSQKAVCSSNGTGFSSEDNIWFYRYFTLNNHLTIIKNLGLEEWLQELEMTHITALIIQTPISMRFKYIF